MPLSTQQKAILRKVAKEQIHSITRIVDQNQFERIKQEMLEEGYEVNDMDFLLYFSRQLELWEQVSETPEHFLNKLDDFNLSLMKHILLNEFEITPDTRGIWKQLNLFDKVNKNPN